MQIKELSERTAVSARLLRYYEEQGLIRPRRESNGYRSYDESLVERVNRIRQLLDAGLTTKMIKDVLPCLAEPADGIHFENPEPGFLATLTEERDRMTERIEALTKNRDALTEYLDGLQYFRAGGTPAEDAS
ncbi:MerR family transcriptional regulator [Lentzea albidocapillata]|uniref:DNA-binding transcriptional regulator, MerR family n=1 Tax=Lentzea albidocapillata TaxID=40571 RepID=A0A1W2FUD4_9PSEU|nr:MerR family transcriptional regulator [Lentzea albidocapillata]SMD25218.1 DNA-binding transcriptional regulator, MerR family [Lentzea albidocapillata]